MDDVLTLFADHILSNHIKGWSYSALSLCQFLLCRKGLSCAAHGKFFVKVKVCELGTMPFFLVGKEKTQPSATMWWPNSRDMSWS